MLTISDLSRGLLAASFQCSVLFSAMVQAKDDSESGSTPACMDYQIPAFNSTDGVDIDLSYYAGNGAGPGGADGALDTCVMEVRDGDDLSDSVLFEQTVETGHNRFFHGTIDNPGHTSGGFYSYADLEHFQRAVLIQPSGNFFTPGSVTFRVLNTDIIAINDFQFNFRWYHFNDQNRASSLSVSYSAGSLESGDFTEATEVYETPAESVSDTELVSNCESVSVRSLGLQPGEYAYIRLTFDDAEGSGSRDETGFSSIRITPDTNDHNCQGLTPAPETGATPALNTTVLPATVLEQQNCSGNTEAARRQINDQVSEIIENNLQRR